MARSYLTSTQFPNTTTLYGWNINGNGSYDDGDFIGSKALTETGALSAAVNLQGDSRFCDFDGANDYLSSTDAVFNFIGDFSVGCWVYMADWSITNTDYIIDRVDLGVPDGWLLRFSNTNPDLVWTVYSGGLTSSFTWDHSSLIPGWHHLNISRESGVETLLYVDGDLKVTHVDASDVITAGGTLVIGANSVGGGKITGRIVDVYVHKDTVLSGPEVSIIYLWGAPLFFDTLEETLNVSEIAYGGFTYSKSVSDILSNSELAPSQLAVVHLNAENLQLLDFNQPGWEKTLTETLNLTELIIANSTITVEDLLFFSEVQTIGSVLGILAEDNLNLFDILTPFQSVFDTLSETLNLTEGVIGLHKKLAFLIDNLFVSEVLSNTGTFQATSLDSLTFLDSVQRGWQEIIAETLNLTEQQTNSITFLTSVSDSVSVSEVIAEIFTASVSIVDTLSCSEDLGQNVTIYELSNDTLLIVEEIIIGGDPYLCWVLTTRAFKPSMYSNFPFNSYARNDGNLYGAKSDGIYKFEGSTDDGAAYHTGILFDVKNMGIPDAKRLRSIYLGSEDAVATVQVRNERGDKETYVSENNRVVVGKALVGKFWTIAIEDVDSLINLKINVIKLAKRR